jgi:hypothetical protein
MSRTLGMIVAPFFSHMLSKADLAVSVCTFFAVLGKPGWREKLQEQDAFDRRQALLFFDLLSPSCGSRKCKSLLYSFVPSCRVLR